VKKDRPTMWTVVYDSPKYQIMQRKTRIILVRKGESPKQCREIASHYTGHYTGHIVIGQDCRTIVNAVDAVLAAYEGRRQ